MPRRRPLPSGLYLCRGIYWLDLSVDGKRTRKSLRTRDRAEAEAWFAAERRQLLGASHGIPRSDVPTFLARYLEFAKLVKSPDRWLVDSRRLSSFFAHAGILELAALRPEHFASFFRARLAEDPPPKRETVLAHLKVVRTSLRWAVKNELLDRSPAEAVDWWLMRPDMTKRRITYLTVEERARLLAACEGSLRRAVALGVFAGLRLSEIRWLDGPDVDFTRAEVLVRAKPGWRPKTRTERSLPLFPPLAAVLGAPQEGPWWPADDGGRTSRRTALRALKAAGARAGIAPKKATWQTLRHSFATHLVSAGVPIFSVSHWLGHASITTTQAHYAEFAPHGPTVAQAAAALADCRS